MANFTIVMTTESLQLMPYQDGYRAQIIGIWERAVRATHKFLLPGDFDFFRNVVQGIDFNTLQVILIANGETVAGFIAVDNHKVEMLFIDPSSFGLGLGSRLLRHAIVRLRARSVDVNAQNTAAVSFYEQAGFRTVNRSETDGSGKPYPMLQMELQQL